jgi:hypothetical protein
MSAVAREVWEPWLTKARAELVSFPKTIVAPTGRDQVGVAYHTDAWQGRVAVLRGWVEVPHRGQRPIEIEIAAGCTVSLDEVRVYLPAPTEEAQNG